MRQIAERVVSSGTDELFREHSHSRLRHTSASGSLGLQLRDVSLEADVGR